MLLSFKEAGILDETPNFDGAEILYKMPNSSFSILVEAPDEGAVHVFERPGSISDHEHEDRIFALFRHFNSLVTKKVPLSDGSEAFARVGDVEDLPDEFVADAMDDKAKARKN